MTKEQKNEILEILKNELKIEYRYEQDQWHLGHYVVLKLGKEEIDKCTLFKTVSDDNTLFRQIPKC